MKSPTNSTTTAVDAVFLLADIQNLSTQPRTYVRIAEEHYSYLQVNIIISPIRSFIIPKNLNERLKHSQKS